MKRVRDVVIKYRIYLLTIVNAFLLLIFTLSFMNCKYTPAGSEEVKFFQRILGGKRAIFSKNDFSDQFVFIDVAYSRKLIAKDSGNQDIADRALLAKFFNVIYRLNNPQKFVLCDILFDDPSSEDALLTEEMKQVNNLIIPHRLTEHDESTSKFSPPSNIHRGFVEYTAADTSGTFLKYPLIKRYEGQYYKSLPLRMYEEIHHVTFEPGIFLSEIQNKFSLNAFVVDFRIQKALPYHRLSELFIQKNGRSIYSDQDILEMIKNRIVVIGDFSGRDVHETIMGNMPGTVILVNAYLALVHGDNFVSGHFLLFLFSCYLLISYNIFCYKNFTERKTVKKTITGFNKMATWLISKVECLAKLVRTASKLKWKYVAYPFLLATLFSLFLMLFFRIHINILIFGSYLAILESVIRKKRKR
ncbi:MAG: CHASE2 domain-containing protein [Candidatus Electrothrix aestuarii]|uniref:CHASE2 domain-containing protein n=1 Tax=Candidatus Electrothrix aestuarii TaxID=3062594 RepID=A0AAU8LSH4_9BACT|nr:CHASE2 domain-containing protein [Candidatus Electrothrix aestuarii]